MADTKFRRLRVLHLVSADGKSVPNPMLIPLLARGNRQRIESQVVTFSIGDARLAVVRQSGLPVHELALSRQRFSLGAYFEAKKLVAEFQPDVLHAWGSTAQLLAQDLARGKKTPIVWSVSRTAPIAKGDNWMTRYKFGWNVKFSPRCQRIVYPSAVASANHRRVGLPDTQGCVIAPGIDAERFKPDDVARQKVRQQLDLPQDAILIGMYAPFAPEYDHLTFFKSIGDLIRINSNLYCVLAGRGTVKGNAPLSAMVGGGVMGTRTRLAGEWTDLSALFNACDVVCSCASTDAARLTLAMAMLCGAMCVATGVGAQGEVIGGFGASVEPGSPEAMTRGIRRILDMPADRKAYMAQQARNHVLQNFNMTRSIEKYHELYQELITGEAPVAVTETKVSDQSLLAAEVIAKRAAAFALRAQPAAAQPAVEQSTANESDRTFGAVEQKSTPVQSRPVIVASFTEQAGALGNENKEALPSSLNAVADKEKFSHLDTINFDALATAAVRVKAPVVVKVEEPQNEAAHWSDDDAKLLDNILVEADPTTAKANADKAAAAAKSSAAKAAANAAFAAALGANPDAAKNLDPKAFAAMLSAGGANTTSKVAAGKPPPAPTAKPVSSDAK